MVKQSYYAVRRGREAGVFLTWSECEKQVRGYPGAVFKKFSTSAEAEAFVKGISPTILAQPEQSTPERQSIGQKRCRDDTTENPENDRVVAYSDGVCEQDEEGNQVAGIGVYWGPGDPRNIAERCPGMQEKYRADLIAVVRVLETAPMNARLFIKTDSVYAIKCSARRPRGWGKSSFLNEEGFPVNNARIIRYMLTLLEERKKRDQQVHLQYVQDYRGDPGNDGAVAQANIGAALEDRPDLDWVSLRDRASETIHAVTSAITNQQLTVKAETPDERPVKIPRILKSTMVVGSDAPLLRSSDLWDKLLSPSFIPAPPLGDPIFSSVLTTSTLSATAQGGQVIPAPPATNPTATNFHGRPPLAQTARLQRVMKVEPPEPSVDSKLLVSAPSIDINFDDYRGYLLEGDDWAREIASL